MSDTEHIKSKGVPEHIIIPLMNLFLNKKLLLELNLEKQNKEGNKTRVYIVTVSV